jgi:hypothetical protein
LPQVVAVCKSVLSPSEPLPDANVDSQQVSLASPASVNGSSTTLLKFENQIHIANFPSFKNTQ